MSALKDIERRTYDYEYDIRIVSKINQFYYI